MSFSEGLLMATGLERVVVWLERRSRKRSREYVVMASSMLESSGEYSSVASDLPLTSIGFLRA